MQDNIRQQMHRYPIFSYQPSAYIDQSELFKDEDLKNNDRRNMSLFYKNDRKNHTIVSIYDRILTNNANDPLYVHARKEKQKNYSSVTTARNSRCELEKTMKKNSKSKVISRFMGQLATSITKDVNPAHDGHRNQKISLLRRLIEHYNIKSVERKYYSNLISNFGLKIQSVNSNQIAVKKSLHPRESVNRNSSTKQVTEPLQSIQPEESPKFKKNETFSGKTPNQYRKIKNSNSFLLTKQFSFQHSREDLKDKCINMSNLKEEGIKLRGQISQKMRRSIQYSQKLIQRPIKMQTSSSIQEKINKYRDFLFIVNMSNRLYKNLDVQKYEKPFKYFIGKGNNRNLIKSLMKKRFWFQQSNDPNEAHFVWSQIKIEKVFERQESGIKKKITHQVEQKQALLNQDSTQELVINQIKIEDQKPKQKQVKFTKIKNRARDHAPQDPLLKITTADDAQTFRQINEALIYKKQTNFSDKLRFCNRHIKIQLETKFYTIHNHFPLNGLLGNKKALFYNIKQYCRLTGKKLNDYIPPTYHIKKGLTDEQYKAVSSSFLQRKKSKLPNYWIMKPGEFSNRGQGITCTNKLQDIKSRIYKCRENSKSGKQSTLIVQQYITNPLLYNGRKFDIRVYMMITLSNGKLKGYWYQEGYVRTSSFLWTLNEMEDKFIHLTNDAIQKNCEQYGLYEPGNKLTFGDLQRYLYGLPKNGRNMEFFQAIYPKMRNIATDAIKCACLHLDPKRLRDNFQIFGLDFMIDENIKPWLIEVNTNPCLQLNCPILERIIPHMVQNAFRIGIDPLFPPPSNINSDYKYSIPQNALFYNKFELVFDQDRDGQVLQSLYEHSNIMKQMDDLEQDQQVYEQEGEQLDMKDF